MFVSLSIFCIKAAMLSVLIAKTAAHLCSCYTSLKALGIGIDVE